MKEFVPAEHRDIASSNADNKFNLATDEENSDFNIPGVPNSTVKRSHGVNVHNLIQKIENHPQRQALQSDLQVKRPVPTRSMKKVFRENSVLQIDQGNLIICLKTHVLSKLTMDQGNLMSVTSQVHIVKEQFAPEEIRNIASFNTDNEFNRAINEEDIDFNIPGLPHSGVRRSHGVNVRNLIQKIENHPQRHALQSDLQQHRQFNPFSKESKEVSKAAGNTELCELLDVEPKAQCKVCLSYWDVGIVYCTCGHFLRDDTKENKKYIKLVLDLFSIPNYYIRKGRPHGHRYGERKKGITSTSSRISSKINAGRENS